MSDAMAIAAVSAVLERVLSDEIDSLSSVFDNAPTVTVRPPDIAIDDVQCGLNLFMYRVSPNPGWRNAELPERDSSGRRVSTPPLALDLHFMLTAIGRADYECDILLGHGMKVFNDYKVLPRELIQDRLGASSNNGEDKLLRMLARAGLSEQVEQIKLSPDYLDRDELSKVWSSIQADYRPSAFYQASVVLIRSDFPTPPSRPVRSVSVHPMTYEQPHIERIDPADVGSKAIEAGSRVFIRGRSLDAQSVRIRLDGTLHDLGAGDTKAAAVIEYTLPGDLTPGQHALQVVQGMLFDGPSGDDPRTIYQSNVAALQVCPKIAAATGSERVVRVELDTELQEGQSAFLTLVPPAPPGQQPQPLSFVAPPVARDGTDVVFVETLGLDSGTEYEVGLQVDGVRHCVELDSNGQPVPTTLIPDAGELIVSAIRVDTTPANAKVEVDVVDHDGGAVRDVDVGLLWSGADPSLPTTQTAKTDNQGTATFRGLPSAVVGAYRATVTGLQIANEPDVFNPYEGIVEARAEKE